MLSESLAAQSPKSPYRRAPSTLTRGASAASMDQDIDSLLSLARGDIQRLRDKEGKVLIIILTALQFIIVKNCVCISGGEFRGCGVR